MTKQLLHLVFGGELVSLQAHEFRDLSKLHIVGIYPNFREAQSAWRAAAQATVDNAHMRYFVVHLHRLLDGGDDHDHAPPAKAAAAKPKAKSVAKGKMPENRAKLAKTAKRTAAKPARKR
jgi:hypothetical protein